MEAKRFKLESGDSTDEAIAYAKSVKGVCYIRYTRNDSYFGGYEVDLIVVTGTPNPSNIEGFKPYWDGSID